MQSKKGYSRHAMRIGFDARWYNDSGVGTYVSGLLKALAQLSSDFEIVMLEDPRRPVPVKSTASLRRVLCSTPRYSIAEQFALPSVCRRERIDLLHEPFYVAPLWSPCPTVVTFHDLASFHFPIYGAVKRCVIQTGYRAAARRAAAVITCSRYSAHDIHSTLNVDLNRIHTTYYGVDSSIYSSTRTERDGAVLSRHGIRNPYVLLLGARNWRLKNFESAFRALARCRSQLDLKFQIVFCGVQDALREPAVSSVANPLHPCAVGAVSALDLAALYRNAVVFLFPSRFEGFGLPVVEAMSSGCPVVCSNAAALSEVAGDGALTVDPDDLPAMSNAVALLLTDDSARESWKARALSRASNFTFDRTARDTLNVYRRVLGLSTKATGEASPQGSRCLEVR